MMHTSDFAFSVSQRALLYSASLLVPSSDREEWRREWFAELWHVRRSYEGIDETFTLEAEREITVFCLGAFPDALCLRTQPGQTATAPVHVHGSAGHTLLWLAAIASICCVISQLLPGVQAEKEAVRTQIRSNVLLVGDVDEPAWRPSISMGLFRQWKTTPQRFFDDVAFYRMSREAMDGPRASSSWNVAHSTRNLFAVLGLPIDLADLDDPGSDIPAVILSRRVWLQDFKGDPQVAGHVVTLNRSRVRIAGVAPAGSWHLPGSPDVWLLEPDSVIESNELAAVNGFVIARLSERGAAEWQGRGSPIAARDRQYNALDLFGLPLDVPVEGPWNIYRFALFLALLALPAVTSVSLGESQISEHRPSRKQRVWRVLFLIAKFNLVAVIAFYASMIFAYGATPEYSGLAECSQLFACFAISLLGFRWAVADQRQRCPMCLRRVTNPATVGLASRTFLGWNGTEMICMGGHALLHVPSLPTSWFSGQRWMYLDSSWEFLFADTCVH